MWWWWESRTEIRFGFVVIAQTLKRCGASLLLSIPLPRSLRYPLSPRIARLNLVNSLVIRLPGGLHTLRLNEALLDVSELSLKGISCL